MSVKNTQTVAVLGAGSWGTALAMLLGQNNHSVNLWSHNAKHATAMHEARENCRYLAGLTFPQKLNVSADLELTLKDVKDILVVVPSHAFRQTLELKNLSLLIHTEFPGLQKVLSLVAVNHCIKLLLKY